MLVNYLKSPLVRLNGGVASQSTFELAMPPASDASTKLPTFITEILPVRTRAISKNSNESPPLADWTIELPHDSTDYFNLHRAAEELVSTDIPVAFPTETVYGLGADATRSSAVRGIYRAKQRPSDNPLIVHVHSLRQVRSLLKPKVLESRSNDTSERTSSNERALENGSHLWQHDDPIPPIYRPLIEKFWPGPLTLIMPNPENTILAPEVTSGLSTFGVRMPKSWLALALLKMADVPLAAPSANASTKPSPTSAEHVKYDLEGRISTIIDGGPCEVGLESTVVDGLSDPPQILRPGGVSINELRQCPGWENVTIGYKDGSQTNSQPKAPGMKYRHYSPKATVILHEWEAARPNTTEVAKYLADKRRIGVVRTASWPPAAGLVSKNIPTKSDGGKSVTNSHTPASDNATELSNGASAITMVPQEYHINLESGGSFLVLDIGLGGSAEEVAKGLFSALRELDRMDVDAILVEGINDSQGDVAIAVMNRLRKASEIKVDQ